MSVRKINNYWYVDFRINGKRHRRKSILPTKAGAEKYEAILKSRILEGRPMDAKSDNKKIPKFSEYVIIWLKTYVRNNNKVSEQYKKGRIVKKHLNPFFGNMLVDKITHHKIEEYKADKVDKQQPKTTNNQLAVLSKCLRCAYEELEIDSKFPKIILNKIVEKEADYLTLEECKQLIEFADGFWKEMILVALQTGLRIGELLALDWNDVNFINKTITVRRSMYRGKPGPTKNYKVRPVSLTNQVFQVLVSRNIKSGFVFTDDSGKTLNHDRCLRNLHRICKVAGVKDVTWHIFRHSFASHLAIAGVSMRIIADLLGHSSERVTRRYAHLSPYAFESAINNLVLPDFNKIFGHYTGIGEKAIVETKKRKLELKSNFRNFVE